MKKTLLSALIVSLVSLTACQDDSQAETEQAEPQAKPQAQDFDADAFSYSVGYRQGEVFLEATGENSGDINIDQLQEGMKHAFSGKESKLTEEEMESALVNYQMVLQKRQAEQAQAKLETANAFMAENATKDGITVLEPGLQYRVITEGTGEKPTVDDSIVAHYEGKLTDGKIFDSSYERGEPATFPLRGVIAGWTKALQEMPVGSKWELFISPELGYGEMGAGQDIGPNEPLIFTVELLEIVNQETE